MFYIDAVVIIGGDRQFASLEHMFFRNFKITLIECSKTLIGRSKKNYHTDCLYLTKSIKRTAELAVASG